MRCPFTRAGWPGIAVFSATKAAVRSLARSFAAELLPRRIRGNAVGPGATYTPIFGWLGLTPEQLNAAAEGLLKMVPAGRFATAEDKPSISTPVTRLTYGPTGNVRSRAVDWLTMRLSMARANT
jgi:NAD(P)-dependent dehydrogenase (short-subunit alcohol dehydrogenase family)